MPRAYQSKKRRVNTCTECQRRKQRCDRQFPCHFCTRRGTPADCFFLLESSHPAADNAALETSSPVSENDQSPHQTPDIPSQIGYQVNRVYDVQPHVVNELRERGNTTQRSWASNLLHPSRIGRDKWTRYCQVLASLPEQSIIHGLINVFFAEANWYFTVLDRHYFHVAHRSWLTSGPYNPAPGSQTQPFLPDDVCFPALLLQVLAIAVHFVPEQSAIVCLMSQSGQHPSDGLSQTYSDAGESILDLLGRHHHSIIAVQADLMRCAWLKNSGHGAKAWYSLGTAVRQAQDIGLHLEPAHLPLEDNTAEHLRAAWHNEHRRRLWVCLFTWESHMSLQLGRPNTIHARDCTIAMPIDADMPQDPSRTLFRPSTADEGPSRCSSQIVKYVLARKIQNLMSLGAFDPGLKDYSLIQTTHDEVNGLIQRLSPCLQFESPDMSWDAVHPETFFHRSQIATIINSFLLALHRPHVGRHRQSFDLAIDAAIKVLNYSQRLFERTPKHQHKTFTLIFYTIDAAILGAAMMMNLERDSDRHQGMRACLYDAVDRLTILQERNTAAAAGVRALLRCLERLSIVDTRPKDPSASTDHQRVQASAHEHYPTPADRHTNGQPEASVQTDQSLEHPVHDPLDNWDFLPAFYDSEDLLTAMTVDSGYTSRWLEHSLDSMASWE